MIEMKYDCAFDKMVAVENLVPHPRNNNQHPIEQIEKFAYILSKKLVWRYSLVVSRKSGFIISGHGRLEVAKMLGLTELPVNFQDFENEAEEVQQLTLDNEIARWAELDKHAVHLALEEIPDLDLEMLGIQNFNYEYIEPEPKPEKEIDPNSMNLDKQCPKCGYEF